MTVLEAAAEQLVIAAQQTVESSLIKQNEQISSIVKQNEQILTALQDIRRYSSATDINKLSDTIISAINASKTETLEAIDASKTKALDDIVTAINASESETLDAINASKTETLDAINALKTETLDAIIALKTETVQIIEQMWKVQTIQWAIANASIVQFTYYEANVNGSESQKLNGCDLIERILKIFMKDMGAIVGTYYLQFVACDQSAEGLFDKFLTVLVERIHSLIGHKPRMVREGVQTVLYYK